MAKETQKLKAKTQNHKLKSRSFDFLTIVLGFLFWTWDFHWSLWDPDS